MKVTVTLRLEDTIRSAIEWIGRAADENAANDSRAWMLHELGHCNLPDSDAVGFGNDILRQVHYALLDMLEGEGDEEGH